MNTNTIRHTLTSRSLRSLTLARLAGEIGCTQNAIRRALAAEGVTLRELIDSERMARLRRCSSVDEATRQLGFRCRYSFLDWHLRVFGVAYGEVDSLTEVRRGLY